MTRTKYLRDISRLVRRPTLELEALHKLWPAVQKEFARSRERVLRMVPKHDPLRLEVDLMDSIKCASDETLHTQALAYVFDPNQRHGFGKKVLLSLIETIRLSHPRSGAARVLNAIRKPRTRLSIKPEYRYQIEGFRNKSAARSDIWIEAHAHKKSAVIVLENKIGASEADGQLSWYERKAESWCRVRGHTRRLLIFLSPDGREASTAKSGKWVPVSYLDLAVALRKVWIANRHAAGSHWLALYIASIMRGVLGIDLVQPGTVIPAEIRTYLGRRRWNGGFQYRP